MWGVHPLSLLVKHTIPLPKALPGCLPRLLRAPALITTVADSLALVFHIFSLFSVPLPSQFPFHASVLLYSLDPDKTSLIFMLQLPIPASFTVICLSELSLLPLHSEYQFSLSSHPFSNLMVTWIGRRPIYLCSVYVGFRTHK